jgi:hypothetical protein
LLKLYCYCADLAARGDRALFAMKPKLHYNDHLFRTLRAEAINPRITHNFQDEDYMGRLARICRRCHRGTVSKRLLLRCPSLRL